MAISEGTRAVKTAIGEYNFATHGGAVGPIVLSSHGAIPAGSVIMGGFVDVTLAALSATGTIAVAVQAAGDIVAAVGQASWTLGRKNVLPAFTGASSVKTTLPRAITITIATAVFTAGRFRIVLLYI